MNGPRAVATVLVTRVIAKLYDVTAGSVKTRHTGWMGLERAATPRQRHQFPCIRVFRNVDTELVTIPALAGSGRVRQTGHAYSCVTDRAAYCVAEVQSNHQAE